MSVDHDNLFHSHTHAVCVNYIKMYYVATQLIDPLYTTGPVPMHLRG